MRIAARRLMRLLANMTVLLAMIATTVQAQAAVALPYTSERILRDGANGILWWRAPEGNPIGLAIILPGAQMTADRYRWLGDRLLEAHYAVIIVEPGLEWLHPPGSDTPIAARYLLIPHALAALDFAKKKWPVAPVSLIGHSLGGGVALELLDPLEASRNPYTKAPKGFEGVMGLRDVVVIGSSLQATGGAFTLPYRSDERPLSRPPGTQMLFVAATEDKMAPPALMRATASRYSPTVRVADIAGANHLQWSSGRGMADRPDFDGVATISEAAQQCRTAEQIINFLQRAGG